VQPDVFLDPCHPFGIFNKVHRENKLATFFEGIKFNVNGCATVEDPQRVGNRVPVTIPIAKGFPLVTISNRQKFFCPVAFDFSNDH